MSALAQNSPGPAISVNPAADQHPISPYIYGMAEYGVTPKYQAAARLSVMRWGGDGTSRYNWIVDSSNAGFDWYFMGGDGNASPVPSAEPDALVAADNATNTSTLLTIPIIPYINNSAAWSCSFPVSVYGAQQATNPYVFPNGQTCGNSIASNGTQLLDSNIPVNNVANTPATQAAWVQHLVAKFGPGIKGGGVRFYQLDNEPFGWSNTHRDIMPNGATYATISTLGAEYAAAVKQQDGSALIFGPSDFTLGGWIGTPSQQNNLFAGQYYLQQMAAAGHANGRRLLDSFDEHYYFNFTDVTSQLASTRTLWDPTYNGGTWVEKYWFDGPMQLIPRFQQWIAQYYPGTRLSFSEYSIDSGHKLVTDAIAEADVLGIFGREQVALATMWNPPQPTDPIAFSFLLFRNVNGKGLAFGSTSVQTVSDDQGEVSAYAALQGPGALTLVLINKTTSNLTTPIRIAGQTGTTNAAFYSYGNADLTAIHKLANVPFSAGTGNVTLPAYSMNMLVILLD
ncbi:glycoside hydrolase family 44 protein [Rhodopila sp.]|uniref:glycoside hydrolase family 44 protein n=1 Tax=Rhodopila sp. TaxID=2480087 RepID=UPI003D101C78